MPPSGGAGAGLRARILTALVLLALLGAALFLLPGAWWAALLVVVLIGAAHEWGVLAGFGAGARRAYCAALAGSAAGLYWAAIAGDPRGATGSLEPAVYLAGVLFWVLAVPPWLYRRWRVQSRLALAAAGWLALVPAWLAIARLQATPLLLLELMAVVWIADTAAYFAGRAWGRRKLAPDISPGKTWAGVAGAAVAVAVYYVALMVFRAAPGAGAVLFPLFAGIAALSVLGDLFESWIKRVAGVKDSGRLLPGHGGILDRIDGLVAGMPLAALIAGCLRQ